MENKKAISKIIQDWINEESNKTDLNENSTFQPPALADNVEFTFHYIEKSATVKELAGQFLNLLKSANHPDFYAPDWIVEIAIPDRNSALYIISTSNDFSLKLHEEISLLNGRINGRELSARFSIPFEDLRLLTNFEIDLAAILTRNKRVDNPDKPLVRPLADLYFCAYNLHHLNPEIKNTAIGGLYRSGKVLSLSGVERFLYPWAIAADVGNILYELTIKYDAKKTMEIGLAYGLSALFICLAHKKRNDGYHTAIDPCQTVEFQSIGIDQIKKAGLANHFRLLEEKDYDILPLLVKENEKFDFIFIDGLHMHDYVVLDYFYSDLLLEVGGILVFDDCHAPGVSSAVAYMEENRHYQYLEEYSDYRVRVYQKLSDDSRSINDSNYHVEYFQKYYEVMGEESKLWERPPAGLSGKSIENDVAIIGIDGLLPMDQTIEEFWQSIVDEKTLYGRYSSDYLYERRRGPKGEEKIVGGMIESSFGFDPEFFTISHNEAELMDPQLRHLLMSVYKSIEDAGYTAKQLSASRVGVFIGSEGSDYNEMHRAAAMEGGYFLNHAGSTMANRLSYYFDFKGPSEVINTMCSSGAFCLYRAVELLRKKEIDFAIVGAATMHFSEAAYKVLTDLNITTPKDNCYSFHRHSEGYIRSEGVITMVLTSSAVAVKAKDFIYATIKEVAVNFNGKDGNSMFSPSKNGQKAVMKNCYKKAGIPMADIAYIEAQGMGNEISDFVEFNAINEACNELLKESKGSSTENAAGGPVISTIKPILGHMECVSALGALLKIILSFRTKTVYKIPCLKQQDISPKIVLENSLCNLLTTNKKIKTHRPMLAGLNSFGASGTNVHILLEEGAASKEKDQGKIDREQLEENILIVSAKSKESLLQYIGDIEYFLDKSKGETALFDLCYTFQVRRAHYEHRVIFFIEKGAEENQIKSLREMLRRYLSKVNDPGKTAIWDNQENSVYHFKPGQSSVDEGVVKNKALLKDGFLWLAGEMVDWKKHQQTNEVPKVSRIPTYPFSLKTCKLDLVHKASEKNLPVNRREAHSHPLLHRNTSDLSRQSYSSIFSGAEFFLADHQVNGQKILPAVAYLEMARAAVAQATHARAEKSDLELRDLVWMQPVVVTENKQVTIALFANDNEQIEYEVYSTAADEEPQDVIHCQGRAVFIDRPAPAPLKIGQLQKEMQYGRIDPESLYKAYAEMGIGYGASHRGVTAIYQGERQLLARARLPDVISATRGQYLLHPSLMDSALQASIGITGALTRGSSQPSLPFALDSVRIISACPEEIYAWVRYSRGGNTSGGVTKLDVDLCDSEGNVCVQMRGLSSRVLKRETGFSQAKPAQIDSERAGAALEGESAGPGLAEAQGFVDAEGALRAKSISYFRELVAKALKTAPQKIEPGKHFSEYGLDSLLVVQLTNRLRKVFTDITSTLFFEVQTIDGLVDYFLENKKADLVALTSTPDTPAAMAAGESYPVSKRSLPAFQRSRRPLAQAAAGAAANSPVFDVAVIGLSGRYPQANNVDELWRNISSGTDCITEIPADRWRWQHYYDPEKGKPGKIYSKWGGFIADIDKFDPLFFKITPSEAERLDPQERLFMETCYHAIEDAGYTPENLDKTHKIGVFVGVTNSFYTPAPDHFSFANKISYLFNFQGPSMAVDTACSSSLTAVHLALESIYSGMSACAVAGGVNILIGPAHYLRLSETTALSAGSQCKSFGDQADGFIDAEGVGVVVLKPLQQAERDGDHIYAVIKGSSVNAGGKTNGYTVPNPNAQAALVSEALRRSGLVAEQLSYIEAHGTGTPLGDPIEIAGLTRAFKGTTNEKQFCSIGSLKSNIGHCESAAGIAGLTKVLLQLKHQQLAPSLHSDTTNPEIDFSQTPFKIQQRLEQWQRPLRKVNGTIGEVARIAGVSSFGIGGANAHIIVQEYLPAIEVEQPGNVIENSAEVIIPLSARTAAQLQQKARDLLAFARASQQEGQTHIDLPALAYTLQVGREAMDERLGFTVRCVDQLVEKLSAYADAGQGDDTLPVEGVCRGQVKRDKDSLHLFSADPDLQETIEKWVAHKKLHNLLDLWVKGLDLDWNKLYEGAGCDKVKPRRISLPVYPFARERYWLDKADAGRQSGIATTAQLHPLLHSNTSNLQQQSYSTTLTGKEFFLSDHQVQGQKVLPAVAYLEMARAAVVEAAAAHQVSDILELRNIVWERPVVVAENKRITIALFATDNQQVDYEIYSQEEEREIVHCQGRAVFSPTPAPAKLDIEQLKAQMQRGRLEASALYAAFTGMGVSIGPSHQGITAVYRGEKQLLAQLSLPAAVEAGRNDYLLHPSLMDSALQASIGLSADLDQFSGQPILPFALEALRIISGCSREMVAWLRYSQGGQPEGKAIKLDIDLCDQQGNVCVQMQGVTSRVLTTAVGAAKEQSKTTGTLLASPVWRPDAIAASATAGKSGYAQRHTILCEMPTVDAGQLEASLDGAASGCHSLVLSAPQKNIADRYSQYALVCFEHIRTILKSKPEDKVLIQIVVPDNGEQTLFTGLSALLKTAALENPRITGQLILTEPKITTDELAGQLQDNQIRPQDAVVRYAQGARQVRGWQAIQTSRGTPQVAFKERGVYLITGGLGGLGALFAKEILRQTTNARIILTGRSSLTASRKAALEALSTGKNTVEYRQLDIGNPNHVRQLVAGIKKAYRQLNGIIHSAGMVSDNFILKKTAEEFSRVLVPKVNGTLNLDGASRNIELDFFVLFSSGASVTGNVGQADYASANGFMDEFATYRNQLVTAKQRYGQTLSIDWPYWREGGMRIDQARQTLLRQTTGMHPMQTATGLRAFYQSLALQYGQILVMEGDLPQMHQALITDRAVSPFPAQMEQPRVAEAGSTGTDADKLLEKTQTYLSKEFSELFKLPPREIDPRAPLERYGIDSLLAMKLTHQLERTFGSLSKTLFFEYQTIRELAGYFARTYPDIIREKTGIQQQVPNAKTPARAATKKTHLTSSVRERSRFFNAKTEAQKEIAIVGLGGKYPQADNIEEFWQNLKDGRDCISEIPAQRWDHRQYFDPDRNKSGKSYSKWGGFITDVDKFDPLFFNISPKEAELIDPQERLFIETVWQTIEDAGYTKESISAGRVGVYVGVMWGQYELYGARPAPQADSMVPSSSYASIANRVSYFFNFHGPSIAVDTMCSSSLTAIYLASEELRRGEIEAAIAGGVNVTVHPVKYLNLAQGNFASSDGRCRSFGEGGDGYVPGEGVGAVLLKPLEKALQDGDQVYAVIKSSTINHGGKTNGYTVPNPNAQADLILGALKKADMDPKTLGYIETHGTGTSLGDPIEIAGLTKAFADCSRQEKQFCPIGSVKSNIGHLESAAGIAALTKALLQIKHGQLVPSLHAEPLNPNIDFEDSPFYVQTRLTDWKRPAAHPRRAGISSFGAGGANAHLIVEEYVDSRAGENEWYPQTPEAFVLSAKNRKALVAYVEKMVVFLEKSPDISLTNMAYTSQVGRTPMNERLVFVVARLEELKGKMQQWLELLQKIENSQLMENGSADLEGVFYGNIKDAKSSAAALIEGNAGNVFLQLLIENRELEKIAKLWISGVEIEWPLLYRHTYPRRVSLPTYPFAKERYWIDAPVQAPSVNRESVREKVYKAVEPAAEKKQRSYYRPQWVQRAVAVSQEKSLITGPVLILSPTEELFSAMKKQSGQEAKENLIVWVKPGDTYQEAEPNIFSVNPEREEHFYRLIEQLDGQGRLPYQIIHQCAGPVSLEEKGGTEIKEIMGYELNGGLYSLFYLSKALMKQKHSGPVRFLSIFSSYIDVASPQNAALVGFYKTLTLENPKYQAKVIEIKNVVENSLTAISAFFVAGQIDIIVDELQDTSWNTSEVRYQLHTEERTYTRYVREFTAWDPAGTKMAELPLKQNGVYLVTGGLGGLGFIVSEYLAKNFNANLVLLGRSTLDKELEEKLERLKAFNTQIIYLQADVSTLADMKSAVDKAKAKFPVINGVIHSAGVNRDSFIFKKTKEGIQEVLDPKVYGTINLDQATKGEKLDLFVLFSSMSGVTGNLGQCDYAYGNRFLDAFAESRTELGKRKQRSGKTLSINWPFWEEGGMHIPQDSIALTEKRTGICPLPTTEGIQYWEGFLRSDLTQGAALYGFASRIRAYIEQNSSSTDKNQRISTASVDSAVLLEKTEGYLKVLLSKEIKLAPERIDSQERFEFYGVDSMAINRFNANLERDLGELPKTLMYEYETIEELAKYLTEAAKQALTLLFDMEVPADDSPVQIEGVHTMEGEVEAARQHRPEKETGESEPIAIIGVHGYYPQSADLDEYWENLKQGKDLIELVPANRWDYEEFYDPDPDKAAAGKIYCKWGGFLRDFDKFDPHFFNISPGEARIIDPQERLFLQSVWAAIEDAGYTRDRLKKMFPKAKSADVGVFAGVTTNSYHLLAPEEWNRGNMVTPGAVPWSIANRVSYFFDFQGPSMPVDTACSSSLVAIHLACESLRKRECQVAVAGGVNLYLHPSKYQSFCQRRMVSLGGRNCSFGNGDDGFVPGEGVGTLLLKPLSKAVEHQDHIYGVITASAFEHSGRSNGYSAPNPNSQASLIGHTLGKANIDPESIGYIEGHGTGTRLGDSLEITALTNAFQKHTAKKQFCAVGSVKANVGHSESAAGMAGVAKILLQMKHKQLVPSIHSDEVNPDIDFDNSPFYLQRGLTPWESQSPDPRRAMINSFGAGGVNACVVIEEYVKPYLPGKSRQEGPYLFVLSARSEERLREYANRLLIYLGKVADVCLANLCYTVQVGREAMPERLAVVVSDRAELINQLNDWVQHKASANVYRGSFDKHRGRGKFLNSNQEHHIKAVFEARDLNKLAEIWAVGEDVDWGTLYSRNKPIRIALPTYPFAKERYWVSDDLIPARRMAPEQRYTQLHPLVSYNSSTLSAVSFSSLLSDNEFYALDHRVKGERIFPGAGFLEIACISGSIAGEQRVAKVRDIVWIQPLSLEKGSQIVQIFLKPIGNSTEYEIISLDEENERVVHSEGRLFFQEGGKEAAGNENAVSIQLLKEQYSSHQDGSHYYNLLKEYGFNYGPGFQTIQEFYSNGSTALSKLRIADHLKADFGQYIVHPCIIDGALQTVGGLIRDGETGVPFLPFALDEVEILRPLAQACYAYVEFADSQMQSHMDIKKFNIQLISEGGEILVRLKNFYVRALVNVQESQYDDVGSDDLIVH